MRPVFTGPPPSFVSNLFKDNSTTKDTKRTADLEEKARTLGFGRQLETSGEGFGSKGEKAAGLKGIPYLVFRKGCLKLTRPWIPSSRILNYEAA